MINSAEPLKNKMDTPLIVKSLLVNYLVLAHFGYYFPRIITIVVDNGQANDIVKILKTFEKPVIIDEMTCNDEIYRYLTETNSEVVFYRYHPENRRADCILKMLYSAVSNGQINRKNITSLPVVITEDLIDDKYHHHMMITLHEEWLQGNLPTESVLPSWVDILNSKAVVEAEEIVNDEIIKTLLFASMLACGAPSGVAVRNMAKKAISVLVREDEEYHDWVGTETLFLASLQEWINEHECTYNTCKLPNVPNDVEKSISNTFFYNDNYVYIHEDLFRDISNCYTTKLTPINALRMALKTEGILITEATSRGFTVKMNFYRENGKPERPRMLRFRRSKLSKPGELDIVTTVIMHTKTNYAE